MKILVLNSGSSSQKSALFELDRDASRDPVSPLWDGKLESNGANDRHERTGSQSDSLPNMISKLWSGTAAPLKSAGEIAIVGHRIVHGGPKLNDPVVITPEVKKQIENVASIAPLHNRAGLEGIELIGRLLPGIPQVAVFDTGFHWTMPLEAKVYAGPYRWYERGIRRYGFHGINHEYCARRAAQLLGRELSALKIVSCHLGNGCSLCAIDGGKSIDTTMGFTPLEGLAMGTRSGSIDPGILTHLLRTESIKGDKLDHTLNHESGLLGISGISSDMREVLSAAGRGDERAKLAFDIFIHRLRSEIGSMTASLGGLDVLIFTAGIGENSPEVRAAACASLKFLGLEVEPGDNAGAKPDVDIATRSSHVRVLVIAAQEDWAIARECVRLA